jgi:hypothetical protein
MKKDTVAILGAGGQVGSMCPAHAELAEFEVIL